MADTQLRITFTEIAVTRDGDNLDQGEVYWRLKVDGWSVATLSAANPYKVKSGERITLNETSEVSKSDTSQLIVSGSVSEQDSGEDVLVDFTRTYTSVSNFGVGPHWVRLIEDGNGGKFDITVYYDIECVA